GQGVGVELADVVDAVADHRHALGAEAEGEAGVDARVVADAGEDIRVDHAGAEDLEPAGLLAKPAAFAAADRAVDRHVDAGLDEGKVVATEADAPLLPEQPPRELEERPLEVGHRDSVIDR